MCSNRPTRRSPVRPTTEPRKTQAIYDTWRNGPSHQQHSNTTREIGVVNSEQQHSKRHSSRFAITTCLSSNKRNVLHNGRLMPCSLGQPVGITQHSPLHQLHQLLRGASDTAASQSPHYQPPNLTLCKTRDQPTRPHQLNSLPREAKPLTHHRLHSAQHQRNHLTPPNSPTHSPLSFHFTIQPPLLALSTCLPASLPPSQSPTRDNSTAWRSPNKQQQARFHVPGVSDVSPPEPASPSPSETRATQHVPQPPRQTVLRGTVRGPAGRRGGGWR
jgi:hypothetical protein